MPHYEVRVSVLSEALVQIHANSEEEARREIAYGLKLDVDVDGLAMCDSQTRLNVRSLDETDGPTFYVGPAIDPDPWPDGYLTPSQIEEN